LEVAQVPATPASGRARQMEVVEMLMRTDQFRELDRLAQQVLGTVARPTVMPMDAWREGERFVVEFDLPGVDPSSVDLDVERNVLTVRAERPELSEDHETIAAERPRGVFSRQLFLGETLDLDRVEASYSDGVLRLTIPVAEEAKPRKIQISKGNGSSRAISA
jgi:HSP20 family protein